MLSGMSFAMPVAMGVFLTLGNLFAMGGTLFLIGPARQCKAMWKPQRAVAAGVFVLFMILTLVAAIVLHSLVLTLVSCVCQYCALVWYGLSYIPFGRTAAKKAMSTVLDAI
eukprot:TRINITY_DN7859_c0_g1_i1.p1 TRINITY_DN7859_c0_g1~~TRINITY_DN7859_c0_g1_i1.p1  ORF type:complete len:111 (+),score=26.05 TRINITY_DN7859_c0_g1_i1:205-537(+)